MHPHAALLSMILSRSWHHFCSCITEWKSKCSSLRWFPSAGNAGSEMNAGLKSEGRVDSTVCGWVQYYSFSFLDIDN